MTNTDTDPTTANPTKKTDVSITETETATETAAEPTTRKPTTRKPRFSGKLKTAKVAKPAAKKPVKRALSSQPRIVRPERALRAVVKGHAVPPSGPIGFPDDAKIVMLNSNNPCRAVEGNVQYERFEHIRKYAGKTVGACKKTGDDRGGIQSALRRWVDRGFVKVEER